MKQVIQQLPQAVKQDFMTTYEMILNKGEIKGEIKGKSIVVYNLHDAGMDIDFIVKVTELSRETIEKIIQDRGN